MFLKIHVWLKLLWDEFLHLKLIKKKNRPFINKKQVILASTKPRFVT
jgi:hypothetical protein